ncbi:hypothetical protein EB796_018928 [Bugula neritina]|uniref:Uncharacterized protein n=1 Tax=Bugula neritina TaxID=10212 RepID=A0A7J7J9S1_BUGNE|nr:hypothetical protein EB796_018928 [Bugula neritina]
MYLLHLSPILQFPHLACSNTLPTIPLYRVTTPQSSFTKSINQADTDSTPLDPFEFAESSPTSNSRGMFAFKSTGGRKSAPYLLLLHNFEQISYLIYQSRD